MKKIILITLLLTTPFLLAEEENYIGYDSIVNELSVQQSTSKIHNYGESPIYMGFGYVNSTSKINGSNIPLDKMTLQGFQIGMGMDLFPRFSTGVQITYLTPSTKNGTEMEAMEFDLIGLFRPEINNILSARVGAGLGIRNVDIKAPQTQTEFSNPLAILVGGLEARIGKQIGIVTDITYKNALTDNNAEKYIVDLGVRIDGHF